MLWSSAAIRGSAQMYLKTLVIALGVAMAGIGSNIMRDGDHQPYSKEALDRPADGDDAGSGRRQFVDLAMEAWAFPSHVGQCRWA